MEDKKEYEERERTAFYRQLAEVGQLPLSDRQGSRTEFTRMLHDDRPLIAKRIGWILNGSYGYGAYALAHEVIRRPRMNAQAWLCRTVAALEWACPPDWATQAWKTLNGYEREDLRHLIGAEIAHALAEV